MTAIPHGLGLRWIRLDDHAASMPTYANLLDDAERRRAETYVYARDRRRFVVTRALLRLTLAGLLCTTPEDLRFGRGPHDKPFLDWPRAGRDLNFNVSHAGEFAIVATARHGVVGVDVERIRSDIAFAEIAERLFSPRERETLAGVPAGKRAQAFFNVWTRKEAFVKAHGLGLAMPLDSFDVAVGPVAHEALIATRPDPGAAHHWSIRPLAAPPGYAAAVAYAAGAPR